MRPYLPSGFLLGNKFNQTLNKDSMKDGWKIKKLGEVCESDLGKTLNQSKDTGELYPYLCAINIQWDRVDLSTVKQTKFEPSELERYSVRKGDLLICEGGDIGRAAIWNNEYPMLYQNALHRVRFNGEVHPKFCLSYLRHLKDCGVLDSRYGKGVTIKHLVKSSLLSIPIPIPPLPEQKRIVSELDCINGILEKKWEQIKELDALAQSIFYHMFGDPVTNEKGWEVKKLGEVAEITSGGTPSRKNPEYFTGHINWYSAGELNSLYLPDSIEKITEIAIRESSAKIFKKNSLMVGMYDTAAFKLGILTKDSASNQACANMELQNDNVVWMYFLLSLMKEEALKHRHGARQKNLNVGFLKSFSIPLPPLSLQQSFATKIVAIEKQKELIKRSIAAVETLLASRMQHHFG